MAEPEAKHDEKDLEEVELASFAQRLANFLLDVVFLSVVLSLVEAGLNLLGYGNTFKESDSTSFSAMFDNRALLMERTVVMFAYYFIQEWVTGRTLGKLITKTQAINDDGRDLTFLRALGRTVCRFIPLEFLSFLIRNEHGVKGWHDKIPRTLVITLRKAPKPAPNVWQS